MMVFTITLGFMVAVGVSCIFMLFRNHWVYKQRISLLSKDYHLYKRLPSYNHMMLTFWIWNVKRYIKM